MRFTALGLCQLKGFQMRANLNANGGFEIKFGELLYFIVWRSSWQGLYHSFVRYILPHIYFYS
jgi:hypothetical protein